jgi:hypothetical protein
MLVTQILDKTENMASFSEFSDLLIAERHGAKCITMHDTCILMHVIDARSG